MKKRHFILYKEDKEGWLELADTKQTKGSKDEIYYVYSPTGSYCDEDDDFKLQNYVFVDVYLDENIKIRLRKA